MRAVEPSVRQWVHHDLAGSETCGCLVAQRGPQRGFVVDEGAAELLADECRKHVYGNAKTPAMS